MSIEWIAVLVGAALIVIIWQLRGIGAHLVRVAAWLQALDAEVFRLAQQQSPGYGLCGSCGQRAIVRHVVQKGAGKGSPDDPELFYCQACWWVSDSVEVGDSNKHYKDRLSERDRIAARVGP